MNIKYDYPTTAHHPFDMSTNLEYYIDTSGLTYLGQKCDFDAPMSNSTLNKIIPRGYKTLILLRRYFIVDKSGIIWKNSEVVDNLNLSNEKFRINSYDEILLERLNIYTSGFENEFDDLDWALDFAKNYLANHNNKLLISQIIYKEFWH